MTPDMVTFRPGGGAHTMEMTKEGVQSMAGFIGLPFNVAARLRPETFSNAATELLGGKNRYALVLKDGAVTAVTKRGEFHNVNPERVLTSIERGIPGVEFHRVLILANFVASLEVVGERRQPVNRGDLIQAGAQITFSPMGTVNPLVQSYVLRLACTNGATANTILREYRYEGGGGGGDNGGNSGNGNLWQWFQRSSRDAYNSLDVIVERYRRMMDERVEPAVRAQILEALLREARITGKDAEAVRALALENPPENSYDMMNLISNASSHIIERADRVRQAQLAVANYTHEDTHARICPVCHASRN